ncbi:hypothetical protein LSCM1_03143 [Leishmania martiniquensis]|uniref:Uncharacterized protein n=1 Tax=Leishmania martiniquensis TaxID=1580590 RepID=A0A836H374_9TRYP|nr:hypothetical protein LSCM1_03143 [Leishmania martiniquensis]
MQYHMPLASGHPSASSVLRGVEDVSRAASTSPTVASLSTSSVQATSSSAQHREGGSVVGITVGQGLLSGRRLLMRVAPSLVSKAPPRSDDGSGGMRDVSSHWHTGGSPSGPAQSSRGPPFSPHLASKGPASMTNTTTGTGGTSPAYGEGIIRISELRRQGIPFVESGLRLASLQGGCLVSAGSSAHGIATSPGARSEGDICYGGSTTEVMPSHGHSRQRGLPARAAATLASHTPSTRARAGRRNRTSSVSRRGRSRGSKKGGSSRSPTTVTLRSDGQLCDYRWFTARGRRCFVYDGRTYKGSSAHRMWEKVKEAARQRGLLQPQQAEAPTRASTASHAGGTVDSGIPPSAAAVRASAPRSHKASARARSAAQRILSHSATRKPTCPYRRLRDEPVDAAGLDASQLPEEWRALVEELGLLTEEDTGVVAINTDGRLSGIGPGTQPSARASPSLSHHAQPRREHLFASSAATEDVIEVTDSDSSSQETNDSEASSRLSSTVSLAEADSNCDGRPHSADRVETGAPLRWPATSYFSDASSGWSSASSFTASPGHLPSSKSSTSPKRKQSKKEQAATSTLSAPARLRRYHGMHVVEQDGWVYPVEVFASQQQQRGCDAVEVKEAAPGVAASRALTPAAIGYRTGDSSDPPSVLSGADDLPLADLYKEARTVRSRVPRATQPSRPALMSAPLSLAKVSSGLSVVRGSGAAVPVRPASVPCGARGSLPLTAGSLRDNLVRGDVSAFLGVDDNLDDFSAADLADMFVTGEEIGGLRYDG